MRDVVIAAIFTPDGLLVGQRKGEPFIGYWECPGGKVEPGESLIEALIREIREEGDALVTQAQALFDYDVLTPQGSLHLTWFFTVLSTPFKPVIYDQLKTIKKQEVDDLPWIPHNRPYLDWLKAAFPIQTTA
jgi:8-oxo-dGTP diphosphatase